MWLDYMCPADCPCKQVVGRSPTPPKQPQLWRGLWRGGWLLPTEHLFMCKISKCNETCTEIFPQRPEFKMLLGLRRMYKPHCHRTAFMNDLGDGLEVKCWSIHQRMRAKCWELTLHVFSFVKRWITIVHQQESNLFVTILSIQMCASQGIMKKYQCF